MRLPVMAEELYTMTENDEIVTLSVVDALERMVENELTSRKTNTAVRYRKNAHFSQQSARIENIEYKPERKINESIIQQLETNSYITKHRNVVILGACGTGKSYIGNALGTHACDHLYKVLYKRMFEFTAEFNQARLSGTEGKVLNKYAKPDLLIIDDFLINSLNEREALDVFKVLEMRYGIRSTIICSQLEPEEWHKRLGSGQLADSILDRIIPNAYTIVIQGDSMRKTE